MPRKAGYDNFKHSITKVSVQSVASYGVQGVYNFEKRDKKVKYSVKQFKTIADKQPVITDEREFWDHLATGTNEVMYADDIHNSLFDENCNGWNFKKLGDIMDRTVPVIGVTDSYLYLGQPRSMFPWHCEDHYYYSVSYLHFGEKKTWYSIAQCNAEEFEQMFQGGYECPSYLRHKFLLADPQYLRRNKVPVYKTEQGPGEMIITFPRGYHCGFSNGFNCAEATNFATPEWIPFGICAKMCESPCDNKQFTINIDEYVKKYLPGNLVIVQYASIIFSFHFEYFCVPAEDYEAWKRGEKFQNIPEPKCPEPHTVPCDLGDFKITIPYKKK